METVSEPAIPAHPAKRKEYYRYLLIIIAKSTKLLKAVKSLKILLTVSTAMLSIFAYSFALGVWFSVGLVGMLMVHEMGHVIACKRQKLRASMPLFIPFLGAAIFVPKMHDRHQEAYVGIGGPILGGAGAFALLAATWWFHPSQTLALIIYTAFFLNLFNLVPIRPLDGGRITQAVGPWFKYVGAVALVGGTIALHAPSFLLIWILVMGDFNFKRAQIMVLAWGTYAAMLWMEFKGIGLSQSPWITGIDAVLGLFFCVMYTKAPLDELRDDHMPQLGRNRKLFWFGAYCVLALVLVAGMVISGIHVPVKARG